MRRRSLISASRKGNSLRLVSVHGAAERDEPGGLVRPRGQRVALVEAADLERDAELAQGHGDAARRVVGLVLQDDEGLALHGPPSSGAASIPRSRRGRRGLARSPRGVCETGAMSGIHPHARRRRPRTGAPIVEIVSAGNEVLIGDVLDTNTNWLCVQVTGLGGLVRRTVMLRDDVEAIARRDPRRPGAAPGPRLHGRRPRAHERRPHPRGRGARPRGRSCELHPEAERMVAEKYAEFHARGYVPFPEMNESRRKMARLPAGAEPIVNPIGGAPGVLCRARRHRASSRCPACPASSRRSSTESLDGLLRASLRQRRTTRSAR